MGNETKSKIDNSKPETAQPNKGSIVNKILGVLVVILIAVNIQLYLQKYSLTSPITVTVTRSNDGSQLSVDYNTKFIKDAGVYKVLSEVQNQHSPRVTSLNLQFSMNSVTKLDTIVDTLKSYSHITNLTLNIGTNPLANQTVTLLIDAIKNLKRLEYLELGIDGLFNSLHQSINNIEDGRDQLFETIGTLPLAHLKLSLIHTDLSGENLRSLEKLLPLTKLRTFHLVAVGCKIKVKESEILGGFIGRLPKLDDLLLNLYANKIEADGASSVASGLFQQKSVTKFGLDLFFNNISVNGTHSLTSAVAHMTNVTKLRFGLEFNYIEDDGGVDVGNMLANLTHIEVLSLNLATKNFGRIGYQSVILSLHKLNKLKELELVIGVNKCGPLGAEEFKHLLIRHNKLRVLKFNFLENYVQDQGAAHIAEGIKAQQNLEELQVIMSFNSLSDDGALLLAKAVQTAKSPKIVDFRVSQNEINDKAAVAIFEIVESVLPNVQSFEFEFLNTALTNATRDTLLAKYDNRFPNLELRINTIPHTNWE